jgi:hypothetical protein
MPRLVQLLAVSRGPSRIVQATRDRPIVRIGRDSQIRSASAARAEEFIFPLLHREVERVWNFGSAWA